MSFGIRSVETYYKFLSSPICARIFFFEKNSDIFLGTDKNIFGQKAWKIGKKDGINRMMKILGKFDYFVKFNVV